MKIKNLLLTGPPSSGKTTVIRKVVKQLKGSANGFFTEEERVDGRRVGFLMRTLDGKEGYLAHQNIESSFAIRRYGVSLDNVERIAVPSIQPIENGFIILDEIGKMECFSGLFRDAVIQALESPNCVIGTITLGGDDFIRGIKERTDLEIIEVNEDNRNGLPASILERLGELGLTPHLP